MSVLFIIQTLLLFSLPTQGGSVERAADWIFSHMDELDTPMETDQAAAGGSSAAPSGPKCRDGPGSKTHLLFRRVSESTQKDLKIS